MSRVEIYREGEEQLLGIIDEVENTVEMSKEWKALQEAAKKKKDRKKKGRKNWPSY